MTSAQLYPQNALNMYGNMTVRSMEEMLIVGSAMMLCACPALGLALQSVICVMISQLSLRASVLALKVVIALWNEVLTAQVNVQPVIRQILLIMIT